MPHSSSLHTKSGLTSHVTGLSAANNYHGNNNDNRDKSHADPDDNVRSAGGRLCTCKAQTKGMASTACESSKANPALRTHCWDIVCGHPAHSPHNAHSPQHIIQ